MQNKPMTHLDRPTEIDRARRNISTHVDLDMLHELAFFQLIRRFVDDQPHRSRAVMGTDKHHRFHKSRVQHSRHGNQHLARQVQLFRKIVFTTHAEKMTPEPTCCNPARDYSRLTGT